MTTTGRGAQAGILIKDAEALERLAKIDVVVVDKTGTLTLGKPELIDIVILTKDKPHDEILGAVRAIEQASEHPLAKALVKGIERRGIEAADILNFQAITGKGVFADVESSKIVIGNSAMMNDLSVDIANIDAQANSLRVEGKTVMFVAVEGELAAMLAVADPIKPSAKQAVRDMQALGVKVIMATGDNEITAQSVADELGIDDVRARTLPEDKKALIDELHKQGFKVAMAGDGVNDAPALAAADVGIAMGAGADVAVESAGITLLHGDLLGVVRAKKLSEATISNIKQNLFFAFAYNSFGVPIAAGLLYPITGMLLSPMIAAAAMSLSSVSVISNALRLRSVKLD